MKVVKLRAENGSQTRTEIPDVDQIVIECDGRYLTTLYLREEGILMVEDVYRKIVSDGKVVTFNDTVLHA